MKQTARKRRKQKLSELRKLAGEPNPALAEYRWQDERVQEPVNNKGKLPIRKYLEALPKAG